MNLPSHGLKLAAKRILVTGSSGVAGRFVLPLLCQQGFQVRAADMVAPPTSGNGLEFVRCDVRSPGDIRQAVQGMDAVIHLAAWHCGHQPPVSDETTFAVNVDGTFHLIQACREAGSPPLVFASSMAYGWGSVYSVSKVLGEDLCRMYHEVTGAPVAILRYHAFVPGPYLEFGARLLRNGVDAGDVATATVAAVSAALDGRVRFFRTIIHTAHGMPEAVRQDFSGLGPAWCDELVPGGAALLKKYHLPLPDQVEQHDLTTARNEISWQPAVGFREFLQDLHDRDARGEPVARYHSPGSLRHVALRT
ncbi:MAG: NAD(P)-dependent oxidoreductase [Candidatus Methylacidiphilales bacterium]|nr:NAD(P)-dependent oxidoreductase [Candidatus Methylacidiphilales bacterium]